MKTIRYLGFALFTVAGALLLSLPASAQERGVRATVVTVEAGKPTEFAFRLSTTTIKSGAVTFKVTNKGSILHDFKVCASPKGGNGNSCTGSVTKMLTPGSSATMTVTFAKSGSYEFLCTVPGHAAAGMKGRLAVALAAGTAATTTKYTAKLNVAQERPRPKGTRASASGIFTATLSGNTLRWKLTFGHLTGAGTAAHIHLGARGKSGAVLVPLCGPCKLQTSGTAKITAAAIKAIAGGKTYVNVHTKKNPNGEIRGQLVRSSG